ncbi:FG-GAP repeat protein [uncultured Photobacterium sp.]|uniref:FG-GAP repeat protein n=1 Tax=uncultured Photobacterium sp. TaxID=173973 RepID=UPI002630919D|nr:FG-GAP repeat protein [uncultured Photobacterium sp.]
MKLITYPPLALLLAGLLAGCSDDNNVDATNNNTSLSSFNLADISAGTTDVKQMTLTWTPASNNSGVTYTVCEKDTTQTNNCKVLTSVIDALTATITVDSLVKALSTDYFILATSGNATKASNEKTLTADTVTRMIGYFKASNAGADDKFGDSLALSADGSILAIGASGEDNGAKGVITDGSETTDTGSEYASGAVYLFNNNSGSWAQSAYVKASNTEEFDNFGYRIALSADGTNMAVSAPYEDNGATGVITNGSEATDSDTKRDPGAVYLFSKASGSWAQSAYVKASNAGANDNFGNSLALTADGSTLAVGAKYEDNGTKGVITDGSETTDSGTKADSGSVYLFSNASGNWAQSAYIKASNTERGGIFGYDVALSADGSTLTVAAANESNGAKGVFTDGSETIGSSTESISGAVYLFSNTSGSWIQNAYVKASNTGASDCFGWRVALSADGSTLATSAISEDNGAKGIISDGSETTSDTGSADRSGAVYIY